MRLSVLVALYLLALLVASATLYETHVAYGVRQVEEASTAVLMGEVSYVTAIIAVTAAAVLLTLRSRKRVVMQCLLLVAAFAVAGVVASEGFEEHYLRSAHVHFTWGCGACVKGSACLLMASTIALIALWVCAKERL